MDSDDNFPSLRNMVIGSVDTLTEQELPTRIPPTWNDQPPLLRGPRGTPETTQLLKGVSHIIIYILLKILDDTYSLRFLCFKSGDSTGYPSCPAMRRVAL